MDTFAIRVKSTHPYDIAEKFIEVTGPYRRRGGLIYQYNAELGVWTPKDRQAFLYEVHNISGLDWHTAKNVLNADKSGFVEHKTYLKLRPKHAEDIVTMIMMFQHDELVLKPGIAFQNGYYELGKSLKEHSPENGCTRHIPIKFNREAPAMRFEKMLQDMFGKDDEYDRAAKIKVLQQFYGACFFGIAPDFGKCIVGIGAGNNGKGTFMQIMQDGPFKGRARSVSPKQWGKEYYLASLNGVDLNTVSELPDADAFNAEHFKAVVTGDEMQAREPGHKPFQMRPTAGHIFSCNTLPESTDVTDGFWRRMIVIDFTAKFENNGESRNSIAGPILEHEQEGILNWVIAGALSLVAEKGYSPPPSHESALRMWKHDADVVLTFLESTAEYGKGCDTFSPFSDIFEAYKMWSTITGHAQLTSTKLGRRLLTAGVERKKTSATTHYRVRIKGRKHWNDVPGGNIPELRAVDNKQEASGDA